jgi:hypothetical protein
MGRAEPARRGPLSCRGGGSRAEQPLREAEQPLGEAGGVECSAWGEGQEALGGQSRRRGAAAVWSRAERRLAMREGVPRAQEPRDRGARRPRDVHERRGGRGGREEGEELPPPTGGGSSPAARR